MLMAIRPDLLYNYFSSRTVALDHGQQYNLPLPGVE